VQNGPVVVNALHQRILLATIVLNFYGTALTSFGQVAKLRCYQLTSSIDNRDRCHRCVAAQEWQNHAEVRDVHEDGREDGSENVEESILGAIEG
jgi:hypothetical protein